MTSIGFPRCCVGLTLRQLSRSHCKRSISTSCASLNKKEEKPNILGVSYVVKQNGLEFQELPVLVRHIDQSMLPWSFSYSSQNIATVTEHDIYIKSQLQSCKTVQDVLKKLDIPSDELTAISAAFTLERIWQLKEASFRLGVNAESYIEAKFLEELYSIINDNVSSLGNEILVSLVRGYCTSASFQANCKKSLRKEIEKRIGDSEFSVIELCLLSNTLVSFNTELDPLVDIIWVHMCHRTEDMNEKNLSSVFICLPKSKINTCRKKQILEVLTKKFTETWYYSSGKDLACIAAALRLNNIHDIRIFSLISKWLFFNIKTMDERDLTQTVSAFMTLQTPLKDCFEALEKHVISNSQTMDINLLAIIMEYFYKNDYTSEKLLDAAAKNFIKFGHSYNALQLYSVLRHFGHFNYRSPYLDEVFLVAESAIQREFNNFHPDHIVQLLCSFVYIDRKPYNFFQKILAPSFWAKYKDSVHESQLSTIKIKKEVLEWALRHKQNNTYIPTVSEMIGSRRQNVMFWRFIFNLMSILKGTPLGVDVKLAFIKPFVYFGCVFFLDEKHNELVSVQDIHIRSWYNFQKTSETSLFVGPDDKNDIIKVMRRGSAFRDHPKFIRALMHNDNLKKVVILFHPEEHYCRTTMTLLGKFAYQRTFFTEIDSCSFSVIEVGHHELNFNTMRNKLEGKVPLEGDEMISEFKKDLFRNVLTFRDRSKMIFDKPVG